MITRGFKPVGWVAAVGAAALGCYMLSLRVASERADLTSLEQRIVQTRQQIRALQTELGTRGRLQQLEQWNDEVLALAAPVSGQFLASETQLASFSAGPAPALDGAGAVQMASAAPAPAAPAAPAPQHALASPQRAIAPAPALQQPLVQRASLDTIPQQAAPAPARPRAAPPRPQPAPPRARTTEAAPARATRTASAEPQAASARRPSLLDARTLRDIGSAARAERSGGTGD